MSNAAAMALDAADGKIDGKFYGNEIRTHGNTASARVTTQQPVAVTRAVVPYTGAVGVNTVNTGLVGLQQGFTGFSNYAPAFAGGIVGASPFVGGYAGRSLATIGTQVVPTGNLVAVNSVPQVAAVNTGFVSAAPTVAAVNTVPAYGASYYGGLGGLNYSGLNYGAVGGLNYTGLNYGAGYGYDVNQGIGGATVIRGANQVYGAGLGGIYGGGLYGTNVVNTVAAAPTFVQGGLVGGYGYGAVQPTTTLVGSNAASRLALDAADGRIDGSFFGAPIV